MNAEQEIKGLQVHYADSMEGLAQVANYFGEAVAQNQAPAIFKTVHEFLKIVEKAFKVWRSPCGSSQGAASVVLTIVDGACNVVGYQDMEHRKQQEQQALRREKELQRLRHRAAGPGIGSRRKQGPEGGAASKDAPAITNDDEAPAAHQGEGAVAGHDSCHDSAPSEDQAQPSPEESENDGPEESSSGQDIGESSEVVTASDSTPRSGLSQESEEEVQPPSTSEGLLTSTSDEEDEHTTGVKDDSEAMDSDEQDSDNDDGSSELAQGPTTHSPDLAASVTAAEHLSSRAPL
eukprot:scaffold65_cov353-Prasinococcus_capsulatus_cf.AAC.22